MSYLLDNSAVKCDLGKEKKRKRKTKHVSSVPEEPRKTYGIPGERHISGFSKLKTLCDKENVPSATEPKARKPLCADRSPLSPNSRALNAHKPGIKPVKKIQIQEKELPTPAMKQIEESPVRLPSPVHETLKDSILSLEDRCSIGSRSSFQSTGGARRSSKMSESERLALAADTLRLESQLDAQRVADAVKDMEIEAMKQSMKDMQLKLQKLESSKHDLQLKLNLNRTAQATTDATSTSLLRDQLAQKSTEKDDVEKSLEMEKNRNAQLESRLARLSGPARRLSCPVDVGAIEDPLDAVCLGSPQPSLLNLSPQSMEWETPVNKLRCSASATTLLLSPKPIFAARSRSVPLVVQNSKIRTPATYNEPDNLKKKAEYAHLLEEQIIESREHKQKQKAEERKSQPVFFPFGRSGSGAPVRDEQFNVVTNVTFARQRNQKTTSNHLHETPRYKKLKLK